MIRRLLLLLDSCSLCSGLIRKTRLDNPAGGCLLMLWLLWLAGNAIHCWLLVAVTDTASGPQDLDCSKPISNGCCLDTE